MNHKKQNPNLTKRRSKFLLFFFLFILILSMLTGLFLFTFRKISAHLKTSPSIISLKENWKTFDYFAVHKTAHEILENDPFNNTALIYHGYSSFYLSVSQTDTSNANVYLTEAIVSMRLALYNASAALRPQLEYMLGKAYFYKNTITSYYYADLSLKYLVMARNDGYDAADIAEYMGLCYASLGEHMESISSFTEALLTRESPSLLLSIAEEYYKSGQAGVSKQYLFRIKKEAVDDDLIIRSMILLGSIYIDENDFESAKKEFDEVIEKRDTAPEAYYYLGVIAEKTGDAVKARSLWRRALKYRGNYTPALEKLSH